MLNEAFIKIFLNIISCGEDTRTDEHGNEPSGAIKCCKILEQLHNGRLLKKGSAPWSYFQMGQSTQQ
jgi:hypothetical protein